MAPADAGPPDETPDDTVVRLLNTYIPPRDRISLAQCFWSVGDIPDTVQAAPVTYELDAVREFVVDNSDTDQQFTITARLVYATDHSYWWLEDGYTLDPDGLARSAERFESKIYPTTRHYFGSEWSPGVDNDPHVHILLAEQLGFSIAGYYSSASEYPRAAVPASNEAEIFLMSAPNMGPVIGTDYFDSVLAHEFQHMIHWVVDVNEDTWVNEGLSELSMLLNGFSNLSHIPVFLVSPATQLTTWPEDGSRGAHYGAGHLFFTYMLERFGEPAIMAVVRDGANGMVGVENALRAVGATDSLTGAPVGANDLFADWIVANYLNDPGVEDGRYSYFLIPGIDKVAATRSFDSFPVRVDGEIWPQYAANYIQLRGDGQVRFGLQGQPTVALLPTTAYSGDYIFWGNRADESDTTLTRAFDLTGVSRATLEYQVWYWIEWLWDYAYVTVSADDGKTWEILQTPYTVGENPHGNAYGPGYTGMSRGLFEETVWLRERVDLTPYAGQEILVRFEYVTDDATLQHGIAIDDIVIPEIGYSEDFESDDGGWESAGWVRHNNVLPQDFVVQMIETGDDGSTRVSRILSPGDGAAATWDIMLDGMREVVVVVAGVAPFTTQPSVYNYTVERVME
ncbi:MAG: immune inhibitor A [Anaerolineae bacterium]|nr:immune inhibitor A [Anaerolineae bacterium]